MQVLAQSNFRVPDVDEVLRGIHGPAGVRHVLLRPDRHGLYDALGGRLPATEGALELVRSKYKPGRKLTGYYRSGRHRSGTHVAVVWSLPEPGGSCRLEALVSPADPAMPQLERLTDPVEVASLVEHLTGGTLPLGQGAHVRTVRYRPGQRHVLVARFGGHERSVYVKTDRDRSGSHAVPAADRVRELFARSYPDVRVVAPVGYDAVSSAALWWECSGQPLSQLLATRRPAVTAVIRLLGRALRTLHDDPGLRLDLVADGPHHDPRTEAAAVLRAGEHISALAPDLGARFAAIAWQAVQDLERLPAADVAFTHGDVKAENVLVHLGRPRLLDLDRCCSAEPARDLGKLLADLAWWCPVPREVPALQAALWDGYGPCDPGRWRRADRWAVLFRLAFAARRCPLEAPGWRTRVQHQVLGAGAGLRAARESR